MDEDMQSEESTFVQEDVLAVIKEVHSPRTWELKNSPLGTAHVWHCCPARAQSVDQVLGNATYSHTKVKQWTSQVRVHRRRRASPQHDSQHEMPGFSLMCFLYRVASDD